jgi:Tfp pilus assembly protein PilN
MASPNQLSFLPDDYLERKAQRRTNVICAGLFLIVMIAIGSAFTVSERSTRDIDQRHDAKEREFTAEARRIQQAEKMQEKQRTMSRQAELAASLLEKVPRSFLLAEFTNALPPGASLVDFVMESKVKNGTPSTKVPPGTPSSTAFQQRQAAAAAKKGAADAKDGSAGSQPEVKTYDVTMKLTGIAYTDVQVAQFIRKLNESKMLSEVNLLITDQFDKDGEQLRKFQIECKLDPRAEITPGDSNKTVAVELKEPIGGSK